MDQEARRKQILKQMARIDCMEKGKLSEEYRERFRDGQIVKLGPYYKHQRWEDGRNISRRVSVSQVEHLRKAVDGYHEFENLAKEYAEVTIGMTRQSASDGGKKAQIVISELMSETEAFIEQVQAQFEHSSTWDMEALENGLREVLMKDGCRILEGLLNQPNALGGHRPAGTCQEKRSKRVQRKAAGRKLLDPRGQAGQRLYL